MIDDPWDEASDNTANTSSAKAPSATKAAGKKSKSSDWEHKVLEKLIFRSITEQRRTRRWGIFFKSLFFFYLIVVLLLALPADWTAIQSGKSYAAVVNINGAISTTDKANADDIIKSLRSAFRAENAKGVILKINSPGGSPVQAGEVYDEIRRLRTEYPNKKIYAVITDIGASGAYYIAAAADEIYANRASIVGSIGVLMDSFGFVDAMDKLGIERRLFTAGEHKGLLDPFSPLKQTDQRFISKMLHRVHQQFIDSVRKGRGKRLHENGNTFSGLFWTGKEALAMGLVDGIGSADYVAREVIGVEETRDFTIEDSLLDRVADKIGTQLSTAFIDRLGLNHMVAKLQ